MRKNKSIKEMLIKIWSSIKISLKQSFVKSALGVATQTMMGIFKKNKYVIYFLISFDLIISILISGYLKALVYYMSKDVRNITLGLVIRCGLWNNIIITLIVFGFLWYFIYKICAMFYREQEIDSERDYVVSSKGYAGTARKMTEEEKKNAFISGNYATVTGNILGNEIGDKNKLYSLKPDYGINDNYVIVGAPGSGKGRCFGMPFIMQTIRRGESMIITDKGDLYNMTAEMARAHGYTVKILNLDPRQMMHSDTCNFMSAVGRDDMKAMSLASTIVKNTSNGKDAGDFFDKSELNLLTASILFIANNNIGLENSLGSLYKFLSTSTVEDLENLMGNLPDTHPAKGLFNTFMNGSDKVKGDTLGGLCIRLQALNNPLVSKVIGTDDIDFTLPGREKCLYFLRFSDQDTTMQAYSALFFTLMYQELVGYADAQPTLKLDVPVTMLLDEFANIGIIPDFEKKLSTVRSRGINTVVIIQDLGQLQGMYPDNAWETIMNDCSTHILLRTNSQLTAEYFSKRSGEQTILDTSKRYMESVGDILKLKQAYQMTEQHSKRMLYTPHEILTMDPSHILVCVSSYNVVELEKIDVSRHPMNKEVRQVTASCHTPDWIYDIPDSEKPLYGITADQTYLAEGLVDEIELCTEEDFLKQWTDDDQKKKNRKEKNKKRLQGTISSVSSFVRDRLQKDDSLEEEEE